MTYQTNQIDYDFLIQQIQRNLPTLPTIVNELTTILNNPDSSTLAVEEIMTSDQSMTMKILRVANTAFYRGARERVADAGDRELCQLGGSVSVSAVHVEVELTTY